MGEGGRFSACSASVLGFTPTAASTCISCSAFKHLTLGSMTRRPCPVPLRRYALGGTSLMRLSTSTLASTPTEHSCTSLRAYPFQHVSPPSPFPTRHAPHPMHLIDAVEHIHVSQHKPQAECRTGLTTWLSLPTHAPFPPTHTNRCSPTRRQMPHAPR